MEIYLQFFICLHGVLLNFIHVGLYLNDAYFGLAPTPKYLLENLHMPESIKSLRVSVFRRVPVEWSRVPLEKLIGSHPVKKFPAFHETRRFITAFTGAHRISLS